MVTSNLPQLNSPEYRRLRIKYCGMSENHYFITKLQGCKSLLSIGGIICNFTPILPYFQHWGDEPIFIFTNLTLFSTLGSKLSEEQKKGLHQKWNICFPRIQMETSAQMHATETESGRVGSARTRRSKPDPKPKPHKEARFSPTVVFPVY